MIIPNVSVLLHCRLLRKLVQSFLRAICKKVSIVIKLFMTFDTVIPLLEIDAKETVLEIEVCVCV